MPLVRTYTCILSGMGTASAVVLKHNSIVELFKLYYIHCGVRETKARIKSSQFTMHLMT